MKKIDIIKLLPVEDRAKMEEKEVPGVITLLIFLVGLCAGFYYWFGDEFIFEYSSVSPFWGFVIFLFGGFVIDFVIICVHSIYWGEYNDLIEEANKGISELIKNGNESPEELFRLKKESIERKIGKENLSQEEFQWHTNNFCWGCGKMHTKPTMSYSVYRERTEYWKEGAFRYSKTFSKTGYINICPDCYSRLIEAKQKDKKNTPLIIILSVVLAIAVFYGIYAIWGGNGVAIGLAVVLFLRGYYIFGFLAALILYPFQKQGDFSTKFSFDEIPEIKRFLKQELPHTH